MRKVSIHPPKTPVTEGSNGVAKVTLPNVCKMPAPPAPFMPSALPNAAKSGSAPSGYTTTVIIEGDMVAIRGASFESMGDMASKGTGGGLLSANTHGPAKFITPGSMSVKLEGKAVHLLGEPMLNNCGPGGSPPNTGSTLAEDQDDGDGSPPFVVDLDCKEKLASGKESDKCDIEEFCAKIKAFNESQHPKQPVRPSPSNYIPSKKARIFQDKYGMTEPGIRAHNRVSNSYTNGIRSWAKQFAKEARENPNLDWKKYFYAECRYKEWKNKGSPSRPDRDPPDGISPDHPHDVGQGGPAKLKEIPGGLKWMSYSVNNALGKKLKDYNPPDEHGALAAHTDCQCG
jgi:uncharacterized Zn-binding protein involved in type VI secretion